MQWIKKGFSLVEMVIVLVILGSLLTITMMFSRDRLSVLHGQYEVQEIYDLFYHANAMLQRSSYYKNKEYASLQIRISADSIKLVTNYDEIIMQKSLRYNALMVGATDLVLEAYPYTLGCRLVQGETSSFRLKTQSNDVSCYKIDTSTCKIIRYICNQ